MVSTFGYICTGYILTHKILCQQQYLNHLIAFVIYYYTERVHTIIRIH